MPHFIVEYTKNIADEGKIPILLKKVNSVLLSHQSLFPPGGIRSRALCLDEYEIADGKEDDAFVHASLKIGAGRRPNELQDVGQTIFQTMEEHFSALFERRYLALSLELFEFTHPTYKKNNIHLRFREKE